jgi:hypothetical protein
MAGKPRFLHPEKTLLLLAAALASCGEPEPPLPVTARPEIVQMMRDDLAAEQHPADGGGRAWLEFPAGEDERVVAGAAGRWSIIYEAGPRGIVEGGMVFLQVSPFWDWSTPQVSDPSYLGYTEVSTEADGVELSAATLDHQLLGIRIEGRALREGERLRIAYGVGEAGALADRFAERESRFWIAVDGDGDGRRGLVPDSPSVEVVAGPPVQLSAVLPGTARPGDTVFLTVAALDWVGNAGSPLEGEIHLEISGGSGGGLSCPSRITLASEDIGRRTVEVSVLEDGVYRIRAEGPEGISGESNPMVVSDGPRVLWGDLHGHSGLSDGTGSPREYLQYARDVAGLDVVALTDHDHWGMTALSRHPELWQEIRRETELSHQPGRFVTLLGYEWTSWIYGHRHVLYFSDEGEVLSAVDPRYEHPRQLWEALHGKSALTFAHHSAGGPIATDWRIAPDPSLEPVTEIASVHGSSEATDSPGLIYDAVPGSFARDALDLGYRLGFIGSGDGHDGHPGLAHLAAPQGGLAALVTEDLSRQGVLEALRSRRVYATNGPRILLRVELGGQPMGSTLEVSSLSQEGVSLEGSVASPSAVAVIEIVHNGEIRSSIRGNGSAELDFRYQVTGLSSGDYVYVRVVQEDGGAAWSSPFFFD